MTTRRYLLPFNARRMPHYFTDILVIGAGIAGLRAALEVPAELDVLVVTKDHIRESNSLYAQGGIAGVMSQEDRFENHIEDTLTAGAGLCDRAVVEAVVRDAPEQIATLIDWGTNFDQEDGQLALTREGGHSHRRIVHALGDATGFEVMRAVIAKAKTAPNITLWDDTFTLDLLTDDDQCLGALVHRPTTGPMLIWAKQTILASGGAGMVYRETTNPPVATGDGMAAAYRAGAKLRDMEFMQFHPTVLYVAGSSRYLITEAVRGEGGYLLDCEGKRFMPDLDPRAEKATRDIVSQAIIQTMERTQHPNVYLDLSHLDPQYVRSRFPGFARVCDGFGLDITRDRIPVRPGAHYMIGGVSVDVSGRTSLPGLWAAGEVTSSGLHGANRLASNSLLEGLVIGTACARGAVAAIAQMPSQMRAVPLCYHAKTLPANGLDVQDLTNSLRSLMVRKMGIVRNRKRLADARQNINFWGRYVLSHTFNHRAGWELQNLLTVAWLMVDSANRREESRGVHYRNDYPQRDDRFLYHIETPPMSALWT